MRRWQPLTPLTGGELELVGGIDWYGDVWPSTITGWFGFTILEGESSPSVFAPDLGTIKRAVQALLYQRENAGES